MIYMYICNKQILNTRLQGLVLKCIVWFGANILTLPPVEEQVMGRERV